MNALLLPGVNALENFSFARKFQLLALLFILPFFLFSALGGQFGEKFAKDALIRRIKLAEVFIMLAGAAGVLLDSLPLMLAVLVLSFLSPAVASYAWAMAPKVLTRPAIWFSTAAGPAPIWAMFRAGASTKLCAARWNGIAPNVKAGLLLSFASPISATLPMKQPARSR